MSDAILSRMTISVNTKDAAKEPVAAMIQTLLTGCGAALAQRKVNDNGIHLTMEFTAIALEIVTHGVSPCPPLGDDVEIRDGAVREKAAPAIAGKVGLAKVTDQIIKQIAELLESRGLCMAAKRPETVTVFAKFPRYVDKDRVGQLLVEEADSEIKRIDAELAKLGFVYEAAL